MEAETGGQLRERLLAQLFILAPPPHVLACAQQNAIKPEPGYQEHVERAAKFDAIAQRPRTRTRICYTHAAHPTVAVAPLCTNLCASRCVTFSARGKHTHSLTHTVPQRVSRGTKANAVKTRANV